jgi:hypothetical protein
VPEAARGKVCYLSDKLNRTSWGEDEKPGGQGAGLSLLSPHHPPHMCQLIELSRAASTNKKDKPCASLQTCSSSFQQESCSPSTRQTATPYSPGHLSRRIEAPHHVIRISTTRAISAPRPRLRLRSASGGSRQATFEVPKAA